MLTAFFCRAKAREALRQNPSTLLLASLLAALPLTLSRVFLTLAMRKVPQETLMNLYVQSLKGATVDPGVLGPMVPLLRMSLIFAAAALLTTFLTLGRIHMGLKLLRGEPVELRDLLSRSAVWWKAPLQILWQGLLIFLWSMVGTPLIVLAVFVRSQSLALLLIYAGYGISLFFGIRASLHYRLAQTALADRPELGVRASVRESRQLLDRKKGMIFGLLVSFLGWILLSELVPAFLPAFVGTAVSLLADLVLTVYIELAVSAFYLSLRGEGVKSALEPEAAAEEETSAAGDEEELT